MTDQNMEQRVVPDYVQWLVNRQNDMLNDSLLVMPLEQVLQFWKMGWKTADDDDGPAFTPFGRDVLFIRDLNVVGQSFKGCRMNLDTAQWLHARLRDTTGGSTKVAIAVDKGLFPVWTVEVRRNEVQRYAAKRRTMQQVCMAEIFKPNDPLKQIPMPAEKEGQGWVVQEYVLPRCDEHNKPDEREFVRLAAGWTPYEHCTMDVTLVEGVYKIIDFDEVPSKASKIDLIS